MVFFSFLIAPSRAPGGFTLRSTEADAVYLEWIPIPLEYQNGRLVGYGIRYKKYYETTFEEIIVSAAVNEKTITGLKPFSLYWFELLGYTRAGGGPITVKTVKTLEGG